MGDLTIGQPLDPETMIYHDEGPPLIVCFTLVGVNRCEEAMVAYGSGFSLFDRHIVIDTAPEGTDPLMVIGRCLSSVVRWPWRDDYAAARNAALEFCKTYGKFAMMLDSDERILCPEPSAFRAWLSALHESIAVVLVHHHDGSHTRERFFRIPARAKFIGRTHEMFPVAMSQQAIAPRELIQWWEIPKSPEDLRAKFTRDIGMLREDIAERPDNGAAWYYLGASLQALGRHQEAIDAFREHHRLDTWEGGAWGCYRAAECYLALNQPNRAIDCALAGIARDAGIGELYWIAGIASLAEGRYEQARCWAEAAKLHRQGSVSELRRVGFRVPHGLTTGPDEILDAVRVATETK